MDFNVLQYNVFARPDEPELLGYEGKEERLLKIPQALAQLNDGKIDVITLNEVFSQVGKKLCDDMLFEFKKCGFPYHTRVIESSSIFRQAFEKAGGIMIVSKWPIVQSDTQVYSGMPITDDVNDAISIGEKAVAKGVSYVAVEKKNNGITKIFHIFATHLRAWNSKVSIETREKQARKMKEFVDKKNISNKEPVIYAGDFNVDLVRCTSEFENLSQILNANLPELKGEQRYTSDPSSNLLVGKDSAAMECLEAYKASWGKKNEKVFDPGAKPKKNNLPPTKISGLNPFFADPKGNGDTLYSEEGGCYAPCCLHEWLDYVLWSKRHQQPIGTPSLECIRLKAASPFEATWLWVDPPSGSIEGLGKKIFSSKPEPEKIILSDLSDHYPVIGRFVFP